MKLKRRVPPISLSSPQEGKFQFNIDSENQNPDMVTPQFKSTKALIKSSDKKKKLVDDTLQDNTAMRTTSSPTYSVCFTNLRTYIIFTLLSHFLSFLHSIALLSTTLRTDNFENHRQST
ncbi:hypothetical protein RYX36_031612, partial [Vicia faba]